MTAADYVDAGFKLIRVASPFLIISLAIYYAGELPTLIRKAIFGASNKREW